MPNGISCACFAVRNHKISETTNNPFRKGLAAVQSVRTAEAASHANFIQKSAVQPALPVFSKITAVLRKLVYPLIIGSGIYTTVKSDDKVKTGCTQVAGIGAMYACEKVAEKALKHVDVKVSNMNGNKYSKAVKIGWYVLKGLLYLGASLGGYNIASDGVSKIIDKVRDSKADKNVDTVVKNQETSSVFEEFV